MKRFSLAVLFVFLLAPAIAVGQFSNYGIKSGILSAGAYSDPSTDGRVIGFSTYGFTDFEISNSFFCTIDLGITQRGFSNSELRTDETGLPIEEVEAKTKLLYATLAPSFNVNVQSVNLPMFFGMAPRFDVLLERSLGTYGTSPAKDYTATLLDEFVLGVSMIGGIRKLKVDSINLRLEAKYEIDVTDSFSNSARMFRNNAIMLVVGIIL